MNTVESLEKYRTAAAGIPKNANMLREFNQLSVEDRVEFVFHALMHLGATLSDVIDAQGTAVDLSEVEAPRKQ